MLLLYLHVWWVGWVCLPEMALPYLTDYSAQILLEWNSIQRSTALSKLVELAWQAGFNFAHFKYSFRILRRFRMVWLNRTGQSRSACNNRSMGKHWGSQWSLAKPSKRGSIDPINKGHYDPPKLVHTLLKNWTQTHIKRSLHRGPLPIPGHRSCAEV